MKKNLPTILLVLAVLFLALLIQRNCNLKARVALLGKQERVASQEARETRDALVELKASSGAEITSLTSERDQMASSIVHLRSSSDSLSSEISTLREELEGVTDLPLRVTKLEALVGSQDVLIGNLRERLIVVGEPDENGVYPEGSITWTFEQEIKKKDEIIGLSEEAYQKLLVAYNKRGEIIDELSTGLGFGGFWHDVQVYGFWGCLTYIAIDTTIGAIK